MNETFFPELSRHLRQEGIATGPAEKDRLPVLLDNQKVMWVEPQGYIVLVAGAADDPKADQIYCTVRDCSFLVNEYTRAMASAPVLEAVGLHEEFRLLSEYNGVVLAGREMERGLGYKFATWRRSMDGAGLDHGNYFHNDYKEAKLDFACRSGLVQYTRQFTDEQLTELYRCIHETLDSGYPITRDREDILRTVAERIEDSVGDLNDRVMRSNEKELAAEGETFSGQEQDQAPGMEMGMVP